LKYLFTLAAVGFCASHCAAASFAVNACDAGVVSGAVGNPISWTGTGTTTTSPGLLAPTSGDILTNPGLEFTSYFGMDPLGPSSISYSSNRGIGLVSGTTIASGSLRGIWFSQSFVPSGPGDRLFIASLMLRPGAGVPDTLGLAVNIQDSATGINGVVGNLRFGASNASSNAGLWAQPYYLDYVTSSPGSGTRYAVYIVAVPTPGVPAGFSVATLLIGSRRRR